MDGAKFMSRSRSAMSTNKKRPILKAIGRGFCGLIALVIVLVAVGIIFAPDYAKKKTPAGFPVNSTHYLPLNEKTNVWISVWLPAGLKADEKIPTLITTSRDGKQLAPGWLGQVVENHLLL